MEAPAFDANGLRDDGVAGRRFNCANDRVRADGNGEGADSRPFVVVGCNLQAARIETEGEVADEFETAAQSRGFVRERLGDVRALDPFGRLERLLADHHSNVIWGDASR